MIAFYLNQSLVQCAPTTPTESVLDYLRLRQRLIGSKEGCASGDCGACSAVVGDFAQKTPRYQAINTCITPLIALHGKQLLTVEDLTKDDELHPVQQAMVDCHASQCGFCTPGFVMSIFAMKTRYGLPERNTVLSELAGNLCRCTGYRPIIDAALSLPEDDYLSPFATPAVVSGCQRIKDQQAIDEAVVQHISGESDDSWYALPQTLDSLAALYAQDPTALLLAGNTDIGVEVTQQLATFDKVILLSGIAELTHSYASDGALCIGAACPYTDIEDLLAVHFPPFAEVLERLGSRQIRNRGTLGGNLATASPIGDTLPALLALKAQIECRRGNTTRLINIADFFVGYRQTALEQGEFIVAIHVPLLKPQQRFFMEKVSKRMDDDISAVCAAWRFTLKEGDAAGNLIVDVSSGYGGVAATPVSALNTQATLLNASALDDDLIISSQRALAAELTPMSDVRASGEYRMQVAQNLLRANLQDIIAEQVHG